MVRPAAEAIVKPVLAPIEETPESPAVDVVQVPAPVAPVETPPEVETAAAVISEPIAPATSKPVFFELKPVAKDVAPPEPAAVEDVAEEVQQHEPQAEPQAEAQLDEPQTFVSAEQLEQAEPEVQEAISPFEISPTLTLEPQTNSIVIAEIPDPIRMSDIVTDAGLILRTGSIEIVPVTTGQIEVIPESPESDVADSIDSAASFVPSVAPLRASGVMNSKAQVGALPTRRRRAMDITVTSVTLGIVILALTAVGVISFMLGVLR